MQRIAPNNSLPATHFIECFYDDTFYRIVDEKPLSFKTATPFFDWDNCIETPVYIFRIRENKLPTLHNFNK